MLRLVRDTVAQAYATWPALVEASQILEGQKEKLLARLRGHVFGRGKVGAAMVH